MRKVVTSQRLTMHIGLDTRYVIKLFWVIIGFQSLHRLHQPHPHNSIPTATKLMNFPWDWARDFAYQFQLLHDVLLLVNSVVKLDEELLRFKRHLMVKNFGFNAILNRFCYHQVLTSILHVLLVSNQNCFSPQKSQHIRMWQWIMSEPLHTTSTWNKIDYIYIV